ncbi:hypothetical protein OKW29_001130 [Paraburkholderia sp. CI3]
MASGVVVTAGSLDAAPESPAGTTALAGPHYACRLCAWPRRIDESMNTRARTVSGCLWPPNEEAACFG